MRFGLAAVPLVLFLAGGVQTYLTPDLYRSTCVMEYLGPRQLAEAAALLKSRPVISLAADRLDLVKKLAVDRDTAEEILRKRIVSSVEPGTGFIRLAVEGTQRQQVRDFAQALPEALGSYEKSRALAGLASRLEATRKSTRVLEDVQEEKRK